MTAVDRCAAKPILDGALQGLFHVENFKYASDDGLVEVAGQTCKLVPGGRKVVYMIVGAAAASALTWRMTLKLQQDVPHAYLPHFSRCNVNQSAFNVASAFDAFGAELSHEELQEEAMKCIRERVSTEEACLKRKLACADPAFKDKLADKLIAKGLRNTLDPDLIERVDFTKKACYSVRCKSCDLVMPNRCDWTTHCKTKQHKVMAGVHRSPGFDSKILRLVRIPSGNGERKQYECQLCFRKGKKVLLRPNDAIPHLTTQNHLAAMRRQAPASSSSSSAGAVLA